MISQDKILKSDRNMRRNQFIGWKIELPRAIMCEHKFSSGNGREELKNLLSW